MNSEEKILYEKLRNEFDVSLSEIIQEFTDAITQLGNKKEFIKIRLLIAFSLLEVIANLYGIYNNHNVGNETLLTEWLKKYCFTEANKKYHEHSDIKKVTPDHLYKFRNAIVHFFALPEEFNNKHFMVVNGREDDPSLDKYRNLSRGIISEVIVISPDSLTALFLDGGRLFLNGIFIPLNFATSNHLLGLQRLSKEMYRRGAKRLPLG